MSNLCQITGKQNITGNTISNANNKTKRIFKVNLRNKKFFFTKEKKWIKLKVSAVGIKKIHLIGIENAISKAIKKGLIK